MLRKIACIQMDVAFGDPAQNYLRADHWLKKAAEENCDLALLPELWTTGYDLTRLSTISDPDAKKTTAFLQEKARKYNMDIAGGSIAKRTGNGHFNTMIIVNREGTVVKEYSKLHLFKLMNEHLYLQQGTENGSFSLYNHEFAGAICYDIRFPEWIRKHALHGASSFIVSAEWPKPRIAHWDTLLKARAIENQSFVIACNRVGSDPENQFGGHSLIINPWGEVLAEGTENEELVIADINLELVEEVRNRIPVFSDRLPDFYQQ